MRDCLQNEPDERPSAKDLVNRLAGSTARTSHMTPRAGGSATGGGHISGQLLADGRCAPFPPLHALMLAGGLGAISCVSCCDPSSCRTVSLGL